ncbi:Osteoclast-stimulating factor 1 [Balamuthia mandrillaris]
MADERAENQRLFIEFSKRGQIDNMEMMLGEDGVSVNGKDSLGCTALHWAASAGHVEAIKWLLANKANPNAQNNQGETPLHKAAWRNFVEACTFLVKGGAERRLLNKDERAAYSYARSDECRRVCAPEQSAGKFILFYLFKKRCLTRHSFFLFLFLFLLSLFFFHFAFHAFFVSPIPHCCFLSPIRCHHKRFAKSFGRGSNNGGRR